ncbi:hypothetical protein [Prosthecobacter sp.]|uniref:hypothetical protein n=1 Tax=Prosthecobacter sp. TaxID=1965333 RepID=UPI003784AAA4
MKTARFSQVVAKCGRPEIHLLLTDPKKDPALQSAVKANRIMTVMQAVVGTKKDWGEAGFHVGAGRQYLVFPKSVKSFEGKAVVGIKYELLSGAEIQNTRKPKAAKAAKRARHKKPPQHEKKPSKEALKLAEAFHESAPPEPEEKEPKEKKEDAIASKPASAEIAALKRQVKKAMQALEKGRQVAAFNLLQKIVEE